MKILEFKALSPLFEQCRDGQKPFDIRKWDWRDSRFRALSQVRWENVAQKDWYIKFTNPTTSENFIRQLLGWNYIRDKDDFLCIEPTWIIMYLGNLLTSGRS